MVEISEQLSVSSPATVVPNEPQVVIQVSCTAYFKWPADEFCCGASSIAQALRQELILFALVWFSFFFPFERISYTFIHIHAVGGCFLLKLYQASPGCM